MYTPSDKTIVFLGDSTLDNKTWTGKDPCVTEQLHRLYHSEGAATKILNYAVDCFQTTDILNQRSNRGESSMRVVFDHPHFTRSQEVNVLEQLSRAEDVSHIVLSVGGNDLRNKLASIRTAQDLANCIAELQKNYMAIIAEIQKRKPDAQLILMNQYTIDSTKDEYRIYELFRRLDSGKNPVEFLHELMEKLYEPIFELAGKQNLPIIDMASSLDHADTSNFVRQIEPSSKASLVIAKLIKHVVDKHPKDQSGIYTYDNNGVMAEDNLGDWRPRQYNAWGSIWADFRQMQTRANIDSYNYLLNTGASLAGVAGLSALVIAVIAAAGVIALSATGIGLIIGAGVATTALASYGFYKANKVEPIREEPLETSLLVAQ